MVFRVDVQPHQQPVDVSARPYALDDLLPDVAALAEVQRVQLLRLLRQRAVSDVLAVARLGVLDPDHASRIRVRKIEPRQIRLWREDPKSGRASGRDSRDEAALPLHVRITLL